MLLGRGGKGDSMWMVGGLPTLPCPLCGRILHSHSRYKSHLEYCRRAINPQFTCQTCHKSFAYRKDLEKHVRTHTGEKPYACLYCSFRFADRSSLVKHRRRLHPEAMTAKQFNGSSVAGAGMARGGYIRLFKEDGRHSSQFKTPWTDKLQVSNAVNMMQTVAESAQEEWVCPICFKLQASKQVFKRHMDYHRRASNPQYPCTLCDKRFVFAADLQKHIRTHTGEKPFKCPNCSFCTGDRSHLARHLRASHQLSPQLHHHDRIYHHEDHQSHHQERRQQSHHGERQSQ